MADEAMNENSHQLLSSIMEKVADLDGWKKDAQAFIGGQDK